MPCKETNYPRTLEVLGSDVSFSALVLVAQKEVLFQKARKNEDACEQADNSVVI